MLRSQEFDEFTRALERRRMRYGRRQATPDSQDGRGREGWRTLIPGCWRRRTASGGRQLTGRVVAGYHASDDDHDQWQGQCQQRHQRSQPFAHALSAVRMRGQRSKEGHLVIHRTISLIVLLELGGLASRSDPDASLVLPPAWPEVHGGERLNGCQHERTDPPCQTRQAKESAQTYGQHAAHSRKAG